MFKKYGFMSSAMQSKVALLRVAVGEIHLLKNQMATAAFLGI